jgi:hypothetical protein
MKMSFEGVRAGVISGWRRAVDKCKMDKSASVSPREVLGKFIRAFSDGYRFSREKGAIKWGSLNMFLSSRLSHSAYWSRSTSALKRSSPWSRSRMRKLTHRLLKTILKGE